jgi:hypothetical protein
VRSQLIVGSILLVLGCPAPALDGDEAAEETGDTEDTDDTGDTGDTGGDTDETGNTTDDTGDTDETGDTDDTGDTTDETTEGGECLPPGQGIARTFTVDFLGFPEIANDLLTSPEGLDFSGPCLLDSMDFDGETLTLGLSCEHPAPSLPEGASVAITTAATGIPAGVAVGDTLTFVGYAIESQGGDIVDPDFSLFVLDANVEVHQLRDEDGLIFAANVHSPGGHYEEVVLTPEHDCPNWEGCSGDGSIGGYIDASTGNQSIDVHIGETGVLDIGSMSWDVTLFGATYDANDCHFGIGGSSSVVRRP